MYDEEKQILAGETQESSSGQIKANPCNQVPQSYESFVGK